MRCLSFKGIFRRCMLIALIFSLRTMISEADAQSQSVTLNATQTPVSEIFKSIKSQTNLSVVYNADDIDPNKLVTVKVNNTPLSKVLDDLFKSVGTTLTYVVRDNYIVLTKADASPQAAIQQIVKVSGLIHDEKGEPAIGATVMVKGKARGTAADVDGKFTIEAPSNGVLVVSFIGYQTQEILVRSNMNLVLIPSATQVDEVVVTALGIKRSEKALSYNVQQVKAEEITSIKDANFMNALSGKVAGVNIQRSAAGVGGGTRVVMRGNKSIAGDNNVLYVVDGIPIGNQSNRAGDGADFFGAASGEGIANFNSEDIESISVLTGPSAAALYGAAAANGVILVNTKKGKEGKVKVSLSSSVEAMAPFIMPQFQNRYGNRNGSYLTWGPKMESPSSFDPKDFFNTGKVFNNSVNISAGTEKNQTFFSAAAVNSDGIVPNNKYHRYNVTLRNTAKLFNDKLTFDASASYVREYYNNMVSYGTYFNPIVGAYLYPRGENFEQEKYFERYSPTLGYNVQYWSPGDFGMDIQNPYWVAYRNLRPEAKDRFMLYGLLKYDITEYLNLASRVRMDNTYSESEDKRYASTLSTFAYPNGRYNYFQSKYRQQYADIMLNFAKAFGEDFHTTVNLGTSFEEYDTKGRGYGGQLLLVPNKFTFTNIDPTNSTPFEGGGNSRTKNVAIFGSAEVAWRSALFLTLTSRIDYPSQLVNSKEQSILYPSVGVSAIVTELIPKSLKQRLESSLSYLKVRGSYTEVGSPIPFTGLTPGTQSHTIAGGSIEPFEYYPMSDLKAERTKSYEMGLDTRWLRNTLSLGVTVYQSNTFNQLLRAELPKGSGYQFMFVQAGNVQNRGIEITLGYSNSVGNFGYNTLLTGTANRNKIIKLASNVVNPVNPEQKLDLSDIKIGRFRLREGGEIGDIYADEWLRRDEDGYISYSQGDKLLTEATIPYKLGSVNPDWNIGWKQAFSYKGIDLSALFNARIGGQVISKTQAMLDRYGVSKNSAMARDLPNGVPVGNFFVDPQNYYETISTLDAYYVYSATNMRLQEVRLTYSLPKQWVKNVLSNISLSIYGTNLWMIYNKAPFDPELTGSTGTFGQGYDYFMIPSQKIIGVGLKMEF